MIAKIDFFHLMYIPETIHCKLLINSLINLILIKSNVGQSFIDKLNSYLFGQNQRETQIEYQ